MERLISRKITISKFLPICCNYFLRIRVRLINYLTQQTGQYETESAIFRRIINHSHANRNMKGYEKVGVVPIRKAKSNVSNVGPSSERNT